MLVWKYFLNDFHEVSICTLFKRNSKKLLNRLFISNMDENDDIYF
jgi:hypothetical protein